MRLSEAIKLGAMLRPQASGGRALVRVRGWRGWVFDQQVLGTCALAAATEAVGLQLWINAYDEWPWMLGRFVSCPATGGNKSVSLIVMELNDRHRWTRERIADWVATIEPAQEINAVDPVAQHRERDPRAADLLLPSEVFVRAATG